MRPTFWSVTFMTIALCGICLVPTLNAAEKAIAQATVITGTVTVVKVDESDHIVTKDQLLIGCLMIVSE